MTTCEKLIAACEEKNIVFEFTITQFGITLKSGVWHWFKHIHGEHLLFNHTYSQNTGKTRKGIYHSIGVTNYIKFRTGVNIDTLIPETV